MQVKTNKVVLHLLYVVQHIVVRQRSSVVLRSRGVMESDAPTFWHHLCTLSVLLSQSLEAGSDIPAVYSCASQTFLGGKSSHGGRDV